MKPETRGAAWIPAVLIGVPGTVGAVATVVDGHEMAKQGQAARALGAAYTASMILGVFGAVLLALSIPVMRTLALVYAIFDVLVPQSWPKPWLLPL